METPTQNSSQERTVGDALSGMDLRSAAAFGGLALVVIGSLGPWLTNPLASAAGTSGDGILSIILAIASAFCLWRRQPKIAGIFAAITVALGVYEIVHLEHVISTHTLFGKTIDSLGWGIFAVLIGAIGALVALYRIWTPAKPAPQFAGPTMPPMPPAA